MSRRRRIVLVVLIVVLIGMVIFLFIPKDKKSDKMIFVTVNGRLSINGDFSDKIEL